MWKCHFRRSGSTSVTCGSVSPTSPENFFFFFKALHILESYPCCAGVLTVRVSSTSFSSCCCLLGVENCFSSGYCCERVQELTSKKQLEQQMLSASWQIICCSKQRWTWSVQSDLMLAMVGSSLQWLGLVLCLAHMKGQKLFWAHLCSVLC